MSQKGFSSLPVHKGDFHNHPQLGVHQESPSRRKQQALRRGNPNGRRGGFCERRSSAALPIEALAASVLEEILPLTPSVAAICGGSPKSQLSESQGTPVGPACPTTNSSLRASERGSQLSNNQGNNQGHGQSCSAVLGRQSAVAKVKGNQLGASYVSSCMDSSMLQSPNSTSAPPSGDDVLRSFRAEILTRFSTVVEAFDVLTRDIPAERDLSKPEWRRLLSKHGFLRYAGRKEINSIFKELDFSGDGYVSLKEFYIAIEMAAPVRSFEELRRRWIGKGFKSMTLAIRCMDNDDNLVSSRRVDLEDFGAMLQLTHVDEEDEHRALFYTVSSDGQGTASVEEMHCAVAAVSPSLLLEDVRERLMKKYKGDLNRAFFDLDTDHGGTLDAKEFVKKGVRRLNLTEIEAQKAFREIDIDSSGEITLDEFLSAMTICEPSLFLEELRLKIRQRYHSIRQALNQAFADEVNDGLTREILLPKAKFLEALVPLGMSEFEVNNLFQLIDNDGDEELTALEFMKGVKRFAPACVLEDLRIRCCQMYGTVYDAFASVAKKRAEPIGFKAFAKKLVDLRIIQPSEVSEKPNSLHQNGIDVQAIFDLLDVNHEGVASIGRLVAALCACGAGARARPLAEERDMKARATIHGDVSQLQQRIHEMKVQVRLGVEVDTMDPAWERLQNKLNALSKEQNQACADEASQVKGSMAALPGSILLGGAEGGKLVADPIAGTTGQGESAAPKLKTCGQESLPLFLKAVPVLAADCSCSAEVAVFDTQDSWGKVWDHLNQTPKHLRPAAGVRKNIHSYYQSATMKLSQDAPLSHETQSRFATYQSARVAQGALKPTKRVS